jgi:putative glutamine amidotransferase
MSEVEGRRMFVVSTAYAEALHRAGARSILLTPLAGDGAHPADALEGLDGLLFTGGPDLHTDRVGLGPVHATAVLGPPEKQDWDFELLRAALAADLPVLGVCYGMQLMAVAAGAGLVQHLPDEVPPGAVAHFERVAAMPFVDHDVTVESASRLGQALGVGRLSCRSAHHQAVRAGEGSWRVVASADDGVVEAIESPGHRFAVGVQWHAEASPAGSRHDRIFAALARAAAE